jgi:hypothetical protein
MTEKYIFRSTTLGRSLQDVLEEMIGQGTLTEADAKETMQQYDKVRVLLFSLRPDSVCFA